MVIASFFALAVGITLKVFQDSIVFYLSPHELKAKASEFQNKEFRVGGLVVEGSIRYLDDNHTLEFAITDFQEELVVRYKGVIPSLFTENQGTVALGKLNKEGIFIARELLAKHDENYMPREVADSLKKNGYWKLDTTGAKKLSEEELLNKPPYNVFEDN